MILKWSAHALADRDQIFDHIVVAYSVGQDSILILRVLHGAQNWPDDLEDRA